MRKRILVALIVVFVPAVMAGMIPKQHGTYAMTMVVTDICDDGSVTLRTATGLVYTTDMLDGDVSVGEMYACLMNDMGTTDDVRDDVILSMRYERLDLLCGEEERR